MIRVGLTHTEEPENVSWKSEYCFGFLACFREEGRYGFNTSTIKEIIYDYSREGGADRGLFDELRDLKDSLPQFFADVVFDSDNLWIYSPAAGHNMQTSIFALMSLRSTLKSPSRHDVFYKAKEAGANTAEAFLFACTFHRGGENFDGKVNYFSTTFGDDYCLIPAASATIEDYKNLLNGGLGFVYQGNWGDTKDGYGRDGHYGDDNRHTDRPESPIFTRFNCNANLIDVTLIDGEVNSPTMMELFDESGRNYDIKDHDDAKYYEAYFAEASFNENIKYFLEQVRLK